MASIEAREALLASSAVWDDFSRQQTGPLIDLSFANLEEADLRGRNLTRCDFRGAIMRSANLDGSTICDSILTGADVTAASLVECEINRVRGRDVQLVDVVIRSSQITSLWLEQGRAMSAHLTELRFVDSHLTGIDLSGATLLHIVTENTSFRGIRARKIDIQKCRSTKSIVQDWKLDHGSVCNCTFHDCDIANLDLLHGQMTDTRIINCRVSKLNSDGCEVSALNLQGSSISDTNVISLGPDTAVLLDTAFVNCEWPRQKGRVGIFGRYTPSPFLLRQPIQDVRGVPPLVRRDAADAQYLVRRLNGGGMWSQFGLRIWGATSAYGQSLSRLTVFMMMVALFHSLVLLFSRDQLFGLHPSPKLLYDVISESLLVFLALSDKQPTQTLPAVVYLSLRICGFIALGIWISIASNRVSRLASE
jgi:uncharacterized protein YjbI with pentapeptide repeats